MLSLQKRYLSTLLTCCFLLLAFPMTSWALSCPEILPSLTDKKTYTPEEQRSLLCYLKDVLENRHAGKVYDNFQSQVDSIFKNCEATLSTASLNQPQTNALIKRCLSQFNNGHISVSLRNTPKVRLPFQVLYTQKKYLVKSVFPRENCVAMNSLQRGDEIVMIDGKPIDQLVADLKPFQISSSQLTQWHKAVSALSKRNYAYPETSVAKIKVKRDGEIIDLTENYYFFRDNFNDDQIEPLTIKSIAECYREQDQPHQGRGYYFSRSLYRTSWTAFSNSSRTKEIASFSKRVEGLPANSRYLKINNFNHSQVFLNSSSEETNLWDQIEVDIDQCKYERKKLILDIRSNVGGAYRRLSRLLNVLVPTHLNNGLEYRSLRVQHSFAGDFRCELESFAEDFQRLNDETFSSSFCQTLDIDPMWLEGYAQDIVVLTSPLCKSSCDLLARTLKPLPNTTILGTPTEGAFNGVSFYQRQGLSTLPYSSFVSIYFDDVTTMVREDFNANDSRLFCDPQGDYCYRPIEGDAVNPHIFYEPTLEDMTLRPFGTSLRSKITQILSTENK